MKKNHLLTVLLLILAAILVGACGQRTTPRPTVTPTNSGIFAVANEYFLQILSFTFDSDDPENTVTVIWKAEGDFPEGFILAWSPDRSFPEAGKDSWSWVTDGSLREVLLTVDPSESYFFRICRVVSGECAGYSDPVEVLFPDPEETAAMIAATRQSLEREATAQAAQTAAANTARTATAAALVTLTPTPPPAVLNLATIQGDSRGSVTVNWTLQGQAPQGFRVLWTGGKEAPVFPGNESMVVSDGAARSAVINDFTPGIEYLFRVCQLSEGRCAAYSEAKAFRVPLPATATPTAVSATISLNTAAETAPGSVQLNWSSSGQFAQGFVVVWSRNNPRPGFPGNDNQMVSSATNTLTISGLDQGHTYHFRVCRLSGSRCDVYSNARSVALSGSSAPGTLVLDAVTRLDDSKVKVDWTASANSPGGFKIVYSLSNTTPVYPGDSYVYTNKPADRSVHVSGLEVGKTYHFRVCAYDGGDCVAYSNVRSFTTTASPAKTPSATTLSLVSLTNLGEWKVQVNWSATGSFPDGYKVLWSYTNPEPVFSAAQRKYISDPATNSTVIDKLDSGVLVYFRVCRFTGADCDLYSEVKTITVD